jgi:hypothetical protein
VQHGFGGDLTKLPKTDSELVLKYIAIQIPLVTFSTTIARTGFIIYLLAVLGTNKNYKIALWVVLVIQAAGNIVSAVLPLSICRDVRALWDLEAAMHTTCGDTAAVIKFAYYSNSTSLEMFGQVDETQTNRFAAFNSATDFFLAVFPTVVFWNLNLKLRIKIGLIVLLSVGFMYVPNSNLFT